MLLDVAFDLARLGFFVTCAYLVLGAYDEALLWSCATTCRLR